MDMDMMDMGNFLPIWDAPEQLHGSRDPGNCTMTAEQCAYKWRYWVFWYNADHVFALSAVYFFITTILAFAIGSLLSNYAPASLKRNSTWQRSSAIFRLLSYRKIRFQKLRWTTPSLGVTLLGAVGALLFTLLTLVPQPYYWPNTKTLSYGNSPPIATRTGWLALGCMPFVFALGSKASFITALTGVPHEKLNIFHNWAAWAMLVLALVHTFPFIIFHQWKGDLMAEWSTGGLWLTGVIALIAQAWLTFMSISTIRNRYYEFFKSTHLFFAAVFVVFMFIHCDFILTSADYFIATGSIYVASLLFAWGKTYLVHGVHRASLTLETEHSLKITVPTTSSWRPGQHLFLRFVTPSVHAITAHPFTVCSVPAGSKAEKSALVFYVEPRGGITAQLAALAREKNGATVPVLLEGPYGGLGARWSQGFDKTLIVAGGAGAGFSLALIEDWIQAGQRQDTKAEIQVVVSSSDSEMRVWFIEALAEIAARNSIATPIEGMSLTIHETGTATSRSGVNHEPSTPSKENSIVDEKGIVFDKPSPVPGGSVRSAAQLFNVNFAEGRADLPEAVAQVSGSTGGSVGIAVCGPSSMVHDVANAAAEAQVRILKGQSGAADVWFHQEAFTY